MPDLYKIERPDESGVSIQAILPRLREPSVVSAMEKAETPAYLPWKGVRYRPMPEGMSPSEFWSLLKISRTVRSVPTVVRDLSGTFFSIIKLERFAETLNLSGLSDASHPGEAYVTAGLIEEAIASSQLEGAHSTRKEALAMLQTGGVPKTKDEQMILNNYLVIQGIRETYSKESMSVELLLALQRMLTEKTDVDPADVGRLRSDADKIIVSSDRRIGHIAPPEAFMRAELERLVTYANDELADTAGLHPVMKAIVLHFWIGYLHPFADGNGRLARAVFYWYLLRKGYSAAMYLPISVMIKKSPTRYADSYIYAEQDDCDLTYFVDYNVDVIRMAAADVRAFMQKQQELLASDKARLNERQSILVMQMASRAFESASIKSHQELNDVTPLTARKDLYDLVDKGYLQVVKESGYFVRFEPTRKTMALGAGT